MISAETTALYATHTRWPNRCCHLGGTRVLQMQQCGQPPQEIVDELAPGMQVSCA